MLLQRPGVAAHVRALEAAVTSVSRDVASTRSRRTARLQTQPLHSLAVLVRGQAYRGNMRETFAIDRTSEKSRVADQLRCVRSLVEQLIEPYERRGHRVDVFLTVYRELGGSLETLVQSFGQRVVSITTVQQRSTPTQLLPLGVAMRAFLAWCHQHGEAYTAVVVTRFDVLLKTNLHQLM